MMPESDVKLARILTCSMATAQNDDYDDDKDGDEKHVITESDSNLLFGGNAMNGDVDVDDDDGDIGVRECTDDTKVQCDDISVASRDELIKEQKDVISLRGAWKLAEGGRAGFLIREGLQYHRASLLGQSYLQLVVPSTRRMHVLKMSHEDFGGHQAVKRTKTRIAYTFFGLVWQRIVASFAKLVKLVK